MKNIDLNECHQVLLGIAAEIDRICNRHSIPYFMVGGTLLGAVRHKGFIPWDDDMDFGVERRYFETLRRALESELPSHLKIYHIYNSDLMCNGVLKISDERTVITELFKENMDMFGINIDIFPFDYTNDNWSFFSRNKIIEILKGLVGYKWLSASSRPFHKRLIAYIIKFILYPFNVKQIVAVEHKLMHKDGNKITNHYGMWGKNEVFNKDFFRHTKIYQFEDHSFIGPEDYDKYLSSIYGDYMQLPPENKRHTHLINMYWKEDCL